MTNGPVIQMPQRRRVVLLGATGSIGRQACDVIARFPQHFQLVGAVAGTDVEALRDVVERFHVERSAVVNPSDAAVLPSGCGRGLEAACEIAAMDADVVCVAITGAAALRPTLSAVDAGSVVATATKEVLVMAGELVRQRAQASGARIIPIDSEHSALWQCLRGEEMSSVRRVVLTASGGPFLTLPLTEFAGITTAQALAHPTWNMGKKITIDSATMMNKGLEIIEAHFLFDIDYPRIEVAIHPKSIVHSYVEFCDGAIVAQLGVPDMRVPIALALAGGERLADVGPPLELRGGPDLQFMAVDGQRFPAVGLARSAGERGGLHPAVLNAANEVAVESFLAGAFRFDELIPIVAEAVEQTPATQRASLDDILAADAWARQLVRAHVGHGVATA